MNVIEALLQKHGRSASQLNCVHLDNISKKYSKKVD